MLCDRGGWEAREISRILLFGVSTFTCAASTFGRTTGPLRLALCGARFRTLSKFDREAGATSRLLPRAQPSVKGKFMTIGTVKFYNDQKGFGFIQPDDGGKDVFVHATALERAGIRGLREGQKVTFEAQTDPRSGKIAADKLEAM
jgi:CspA family cold shock protein